ncbi:c-type cytochrome biogenesis protein CcsB [Desulfosudis oleivorans]|uniref:Heme exporter protein C n=1 Tax=Desulfosudis oleivorans (strain DSM 6200 / JCM 39069 / Hxd3) TaxID=96561 RepID=A8ZX54_DESOH|nr:c-type cytochrome biogenesis protein CcsB [Desulfosudis oleivorans]ABW66910.1 cytochrome c assembly protein [Desulfosudis oleivorans Hxd3]
MINAYILSTTTFVYGLAVVAYVAAWAFENRFAGKAATTITWIAVAANLAGILVRWFESHQMGHGYVPLSNLYESLVFFAFAIGVVYLMIERRFKTQAFGAGAILLAFIALAYASLSPEIENKIQPLIPALQSNWLTAHVITCFLGYAAFAIAFAVSVIYLIKQGKEGEDAKPASAFVPSSETLDELIHQTVVFGFFFLSVGIITGAVWANTAWGRYWGWDPKETWSLITWFIYAAMLHVRLMRGWQNKRIAWFAIAGFAAVLFTYFGVNLLPGLHSYQ